MKKVVLIQVEAENLSKLIDLLGDSKNVLDYEIVKTKWVEEDGE